MKVIEVLTPSGHTDTLRSIAEQIGAVDCWVGPEGEDGRRMTHILLADEKTQKMLDALQSALAAADNTHITLSPVEASLPRPAVNPDEEKVRSVIASRESLYEEIEKNARLDRNYLLLVIFSTVVAAIGLIEDNIAVIIGAMVIAPLLGPNIALALGTALGDTHLIRRSLLTNAAGLGLAIGMSVLIGVLSSSSIYSHELLSRTTVGLDSIVLALASGAAAVLSLTTGLPTVLVGVMVAVALLPPAATFGFMLGAMQFDLAAGAGILLAVNVVCVNLAAKIVFLAQGLRPRTWVEKAKARQSTKAYILIWIVSLLILVGLIYLRKQTG